MDPSNGTAIVTTTTYNSVVSYTCDPGYDLFGVETRTCDESGVWTDGEPSCHGNMFELDADYACPSMSPSVPFQLWTVEY